MTASIASRPCKLYCDLSSMRRRRSRIPVRAAFCSNSLRSTCNCLDMGSLRTRGKSPLRRAFSFMSCSLARGVAYGARAPKPYVSAVVAISCVIYSTRAFDRIGLRSDSHWLGVQWPSVGGTRSTLGGAACVATAAASLLPLPPLPLRLRSRFPPRTGRSAASERCAAAPAARWSFASAVLVLVERPQCRPEITRAAALASEAACPLSPQGARAHAVRRPLQQGAAAAAAPLYPPLKAPPREQRRLVFQSRRL